MNESILNDGLKREILLIFANFYFFLFPEEKNLEVPLDSMHFSIKFLRPAKYYPESTFDRIKKYYKFKVKHKKICDNLIPSDVRHVFDQGIIQFLPVRDQDRRRVLLLEVGSEYHSESNFRLQNSIIKPNPGTRALRYMNIKPYKSFQNFRLLQQIS